MSRDAARRRRIIPLGMGVCGKEHAGGFETGPYKTQPEGSSRPIVTVCSGQPGRGASP